MKFLSYNVIPLIPVYSEHHTTVPWFHLLSMANHLWLLAITLKSRTLLFMKGCLGIHFQLTLLIGGYSPESDKQRYLKVLNFLWSMLSFSTEI